MAERLMSLLQHVDLMCSGIAPGGPGDFLSEDTDYLSRRAEFLRSRRQAGEALADPAQRAEFRREADETIKRADDVSRATEEIRAARRKLGERATEVRRLARERPGMGAAEADGYVEELDRLIVDVSEAMAAAHRLDVLHMAQYGAILKRHHGKAFELLGALFAEFDAAEQGLAASGTG